MKASEKPSERRNGMTTFYDAAWSYVATATMPRIFTSIKNRVRLGKGVIGPHPQERKQLQGLTPVTL
ncbi:hypothetical protein GCM10011507_12090 [Edaphobacter acidisoli]|uniref:Uncharacterized protein n=1 Tax=Edaphobacter acidisoli TaxID=2040573 RepID=A0A916RPM0_9BACT|nr:hypothetical protein GCM10011507_12090 [Edaphobacter acidisoli]